MKMATRRKTIPRAYLKRSSLKKATSEVRNCTNPLFFFLAILQRVELTF